MFWELCRICGGVFELCWELFGVLFASFGGLVGLFWELFKGVRFGRLGFTHYKWSR